MKYLLLITVLFFAGCCTVEEKRNWELKQLKNMLPTTAVVVSEKGEGGGWYKIEYNSGIYLARIEPTYGAINLNLVPYTGR